MMILICLTTLVALAQCIHYGSADPAMVVDDSEKEYVVATSSELTLLFQKCDLNFSSTVTNSDDNRVKWISNDEGFMHFILPAHGDLCGSEGFMVEEDDDEEDPADKNDYKTKGQQRRLTAKSDKKDSKTGKKSSSMTTIATSCPTCCGGTRNNRAVSVPGACVGLGTQFPRYGFATYQDPTNLLQCTWESADQTDCNQLGFKFNSRGYPASCTTTLQFAPGQCLLLTRKLRDDDDNKTIPMKKHKTAIGFVRVPKTGSTSMLQLLFQLPYMLGWGDHLSDGDDDNQEEERIFEESAALGGNDKKQTKKSLSAISCVFAYAPTKAHLGSNFQSGAARRGPNDCPHIPYPGLLKKWASSLERWSPPKTAVLEQSNDRVSFSFGFQAFSVVRDPFDRLVSFFFYIQRNQFLKNTVTDEQYDRVLAGDLYGWMELLHEQGGCGLQLPFQYHYFHHDLETAIDLIEQQEDENGKASQPPKVFTLLTECYKPSLYLMAEALEGLEIDMVEEFVNSPSYKSNENKHSVTNKHSYEEGKVSGDLKSLRELAEVWFEEDFLFYNAAVRQFKKYMAQSAVDPIHFQDCPYWEEKKESNNVAATQKVMME